MNTPLQIQLVKHARDSAWRPRMLTWKELIPLLTTHERRGTISTCQGGHEIRIDSIGQPCPGGEEIRTGKDGPGFSPVVADDGTRRGNASVRAMSLAVLDLDGQESDGIDPDTFTAIVNEVEKSGLACIVYTSHNHSADACKARLVFQINRNVWPLEWPILRAHLIRRFNLGPREPGNLKSALADMSTKDLSRFYFLPSAPEGAPAFAGVSEGRPVNVDEVIATEQNEHLRESASQISEQTYSRIAGIAAARQANEEPIDLDGLRNVLRSTQGRNRELIQKVLKGEPLAQVGGRDDALNRTISAIRFSVPATTSPEALLEILRPSLTHFEVAIDPLTGKREDWIESAREKIERHGNRRIASDAVKAAIAHDTWQALRHESSRTREPAQAAPRAEAADTPGSADAADSDEENVTERYTPAQIAQWAQEQGCESISEFDRRWLIQRAQATYIFVEGRYLAPVPRENLFDAVKRDLARSPVEVYAQDKKGNLQPTPVGRLLELHSTVARTVEASLILQRSTYDADTHTFHEACTPLRKSIQPIEHKEIALWLELLDPTGKLTDWVASVTRLDRYSCAIYLDTKPGTGKTLLANGLAKLWTPGGPTELGRVLEGFNESLTRCPLIFADEAIPRTKGVTATLRTLIGSTTRALSRKFLPTCDLNGAVRLIIAGNNDRLLDTGEELSVNDLAAIASRFLYLNAGDKAAGYLEALGGPPVVGKWINENLLAEHALYLRETHRFSAGKRFIVEGDATEFHRHLATGSGMAGLICEWVTRWLAEPVSSAFVHVGEGEVWINTEALAKPTAWERFLPAARVPSAAQIGRSLRALSHGTGKLTISGANMTFFRIKAELLQSWIDRLQIGDTEAIRLKLLAPNEVIRSGGTL